MKCTPLLAVLGLGALALGDEPDCVEIVEPVQVQIFANGEPIDIDLQQIDLQGGLRIQLGDGIQLPDVQQGVPQTEAIPEKYADLKVVTMIMEDMKHHTDGLGYEVTFRIINPTEELMQFPGTSEKDPMAKKQMWRKGAWEEDKNHEYATNTRIRKCRIEPGQSAVFKASFMIDELPARIGVGYSNGHHNGKHMKVWSEKIER